MLLFLLACFDGFDHPALREGEAEYDPNDLTDPHQDTGDDPDSAHPEDTGDDTDTGDDMAPTAVCYPGEDSDYTACLPLTPHRSSWGVDYAYPEPYDGSQQYSAPVRFIDLTAADPSLLLAPNFALDEVMQEYKGDYGLYQVHVMEYIQAIRDTIGGALYVNSGYRNVSYNAGVGGSTYSRHMYGDAVDMYSNSASLSELADICDSLGAGYVSEYETHVHCDWRDDLLDVAFYDVGRSHREAPRQAHHGTLHEDGGRWTAAAAGFDEGEPLLRWAAWGADGVLLEVAEGAAYVPPPEAARLTVDIGGQLTVAAEGLTEAGGSQ
ncbi:MAG: D-Ala-D-Ala carboxypeptidase family metallohydrolase [Myxococcota bacterium]|nr:D-Ala-D-Ala carboxypeptidase family metallohydrolase [Myxococcota bacterium]